MLEVASVKKKLFSESRHRINEKICVTKPIVDEYSLHDDKKVKVRASLKRDKNKVLVSTGL